MNHKDIGNISADLSFAQYLSEFGVYLKHMFGRTRSNMLIIALKASRSSQTPPSKSARVLNIYKEKN